MPEIFKTMVKSGETYYTSRINKDANGGLLDRSDRARLIMVPDPVTGGSLTMIQGCFWDKIKAIEHGFIQGMTKEQMLERFKSKITTKHHSISIDGSAFDSAQKAQIMKVADNRFWDIAKSDIVKLLAFNRFIEPLRQANRIVKEAQKTVHTGFMKIPGVNAPQMPAHMKKSLGLVTHLKPEEESDWVGFTLNGTTFSGHPTRTTLGNTFRSLLYAYYYIENIGISDPWENNEEGFVAASGDDVVMWIIDGKQEQLRDSVMKLTARKKSDKIFVGIGQGVEEVKLSTWHDIDFGSKWAFGSNENSLDSWYLYRDYQKTLSTKQYYTKKNAFVHKNPLVHATALYECLKAEHASHLLEFLMVLRINYLEKTHRYRDIIEARNVGSLIYRAIQQSEISGSFQRQTMNEFIYTLSDYDETDEFKTHKELEKDKYKLWVHSSSSDSYPFEQEINERLNLKFGNLVELYKTQRLELFG